ncbi:ABC transporter ATP-binding protein [Paratractidigestivibacter sp.]|uniref:ABC transporter ATP-binding protein n=1 Tax=Paratractidigestivibacter sp. TaxID=2847316 RepID=UPI002AC8FB5F|nr:ABC transporter ATP-binding protein [Paratractidigestivibacter sp.]
MNSATTQTNKDQTIRRMLGLFAHRRRSLAALVALGVVVTVGTLTLPTLSGEAVDRVVGAGQVDFEGLAHVLQWMAAVVCLTCAAQYALAVVTNRLAYDAAFDLREQAFDRLQSMPLSYVDTHEHGEIASRIVNDADQLTNGFVMGFQQLPTGILTIVVTLVFMFRLNFVIALVVTVLTPFSVWAAKFISSHASRHFAGQTQLRGELTGLVEEMIGGVGTIEAFGVADSVCERMRDVDGRLGSESYKAVFFSSLANPTMRFMNSLVYAAIGIFGAFVAISGGITVGGLSAFLSYADQYAKPFNDITGVVTELQNSIACARHLFELIDEPLEAPDAEGAAALGQVEGTVALDDVTFSYVPGKPILEHVELAAEPGQRIALVGHTGCGKTTLINLLMRFYDVDSGHVTIDGHDVRDLTRASLRGCWGMVLQDTWVRRATVRENIAIGNPAATDDQIVAAAKAAYADGFISRLPHGYDTVLDGSASLSAGQKQLLCIARVMVAKPQMLILDEATSNIDTRTEVLVQRAFDNLMRGRTSFVVAHRLSTVRDADAICVVDHGRIAEKGTHDELLAAGGLYREIYESQFAPAE